MSSSFLITYTHNPTLGKLCVAGAMETYIDNHKLHANLQDKYNVGL